MTDYTHTTTLRPKKGGRRHLMLGGAEGDGTALCGIPCNGWVVSPDPPDCRRCLSVHATLIRPNLENYVIESEPAPTVPENRAPSPSVLPTATEPENKAPRGSAARLHLLAETVLKGFEMSPDPWYPEFQAWREALLGERPHKQGGTRGFENWNLVSLGMHLAWVYFAGELGEAVEEVASQPRPEPTANVDAPVEYAQLVLPGIPDVSKATFTVLGADGQAVIEGYK